MNGIVGTNPEVESTAARAAGQWALRRGSEAEIEPIGCEEWVGGGPARSFKSAGVGELQLCSAFGRIWGLLGSAEQSRHSTRQMTSRWPGLGASKRRRSLQDHKQLEESEVLQPAAGHMETSSGALGSLCRQFQRRLPLRAVSLNLGPGPSWKRLETPEPEQQGFQAAARSAKNALGAMSQRIQESCQSGTKWLVETQVKARRRKRRAQRDESPPTPGLSQRGTHWSRAAPTHPTLGPWEREPPRPSAQMGPHTHTLRWSKREAAFWSPYSSTEPLCSPSESDSDLEPMGAGIQHLRKLSQELDEAIVAEESGDMTTSLLRN